MKSVAEKFMARSAEAEIRLSGVQDLMEDRYPGDNKTKLKTEQKLYYASESDCNLIIPARNIRSFLCSKGRGSRSAVKALYTSRIYGPIADAVSAFVRVTPAEIPLCRNGKQLKFEGFGKNGITSYFDVPRVDNVPFPKHRPLIALPWELAFTLTILPNPTVTMDLVHRLFAEAGVPIGLGTYRGPYGGFIVSEWNVIRVGKLKG